MVFLETNLVIEQIDTNHWKMWVNGNDYWVVCADNVGLALCRFESFSVYRAKCITIIFKERK
jgi:hypothetical protein